MSAIDTLQVSKDLQAASFTPTQAEALAKLLRDRQEADLSQLATKTDLEHLGAATKAELDQLRMATKADIEQLRAATKAELVQLEQRLTIKLGGMLALAVGVTTALVKLL